MTHHRKKRVLGGESIITSVKRNVKSKGADENSEGGFSQKVAGTLGIESIITVAKRIVIFRKGDESSGGLLSKVVCTAGLSALPHYEM